MFNQFCTERGIKLSTIRGYESAIICYTKFHRMSLDDLLKEAVEEEKIEDKRQRKLRNRLMKYRIYMMNSKIHTQKTAKLYIKRIMTIYRHFQVEIPPLPRLVSTDETEFSYFDLPNKHHIKIALESADLQMHGVILFISSSGTSLSDVANLTVGDFIAATSEYHNYLKHKEEDIPVIIEKLESISNEIVPTFNIRRQKTNKHYYTFCTPETSSKILEYLKTKEFIKADDSLFGVTRRTIRDRLARLNDKLGFGFKGKYRFFRAHTLRKFHASNIGLAEEYVDMLQGRSKDSVHASYIKINPLALKEIYLNAMNNVIINTDNFKVNLNKGNKSYHQEFNIIININITYSDYEITL